MNKVDTLLKTPFSSLKLEQKLGIKSLGAHQPSNFTFSHVCGKRKRTFNNTWFERKMWLTASEKKQSLFCFYCLLFGGEKSGYQKLWTTSGVTDLKHISERIKRHEETKVHLENYLNFKTFGIVNTAAQNYSVVNIIFQKHNEQVRKNRHVLGRVIEYLKLYDTHKLALKNYNESRESANCGNFLDLLSSVGNIDNMLDGHLNSSSPLKYRPTSHAEQNELLHYMYEVYIEELIKDINAADFVAVQVDETADIYCKNQFVIILRYIKGSKPVERFLSFIEVHDCTANGLSEILKEILQPFNAEKVIAQAYDGAALMKGNEGGIQTVLQKTFPHAKHVHSYAHDLSLVIKSACSKSIKEVKVFFANIMGFTAFFSSLPKRNNLLHSLCNKHMPAVSGTTCNFQTQVITCVKENRVELLQCFEKIEEDGWDDVTLREAYGLKNLLYNGEFLFFLNFFYDIMKHVDVLYKRIQFQSAHLVISRELQNFLRAITEMRENAGRYRCLVYADEIEYAPSSSKRIKHNWEENLATSAIKVCDIVYDQLKERFQESYIFGCFAIIDPKNFAFYRRNFPNPQVETFVSNYQPIISKEKLKKELSVIYENDAFRFISSVCELYSFFMRYSFGETFTEVSKVLKIVLTTPITTFEAERSFNTLKKIRTFLRNTESQDRLNSMAICSIHKEELNEIPDFKNRVIDMFASQKNREAQLLYKGNKHDLFHSGDQNNETCVDKSKTKRRKSAKSVTPPVEKDSSQVKEDQVNTKPQEYDSELLYGDELNQIDIKEEIISLYNETEIEDSKEDLAALLEHCEKMQPWKSNMQEDESQVSVSNELTNKTDTEQ